MEALNNHSLKKTKIFRGNHKPHINKTTRKAIMKRSQLKNEANKTKDAKDTLKYIKRRNYVVKFKNQEHNQEHFHSLNPFLDSNPFWMSCKPYFSNKHLFGDVKTALNGNSEIFTQSMKIAKSFNSFFESVTGSLKLFDWPVQSNISYGKVKILLKVFPIILVLLKSSKFKVNKKFSFHCVSETIIRKVVKSLSSDKATAGEISVNVLKNSENCFFDLTSCVNETIGNNKFQDHLKLSDITPL